MISSIVKIFSLFAISQSIAADNFILKDHELIEGQLQHAVNCIPSFSNNSYQFCNGLSLTADQYRDFLSFNLDQCKKKMVKLGHHIWQTTPSNGKDEFSQFVRSTARAQVIHEKKMVFFRKDIGRIDCLHELLHIYQRQYCGKGELCPLNRQQMSKSILAQLDSAVEKVAQWEKLGKVELAKNYADSMAPGIKLYQRYEDAINWLDEKDVHFFIYQHCKELGCTLEDKEIALANLFKLRSFFPPRYLSYIRQEAADVIESKKKIIEKELLKDWSNLSEAQLKVMDSIAPDTIINHFSATLSANETFYKVIAPQVKQSLGSPFVSFDKMNEKVKTLQAENPKYSLLQSSDFDGVQYLCNIEKMPFFAYGSTVSYFSLLREYYTYYSAVNNPRYCQLMLELPKLRSDFSQSLVSREFYENKLLESMIFQFAIKRNFAHWLLSSDVGKNNFIQLAPFLAQYYLPSSTTLPNGSGLDQPKAKLESPEGEIHLNIEESLPSIHLLERKFVFDTGAMNSVLSPSLLNLDLYRQAEWIKNITFHLVDGRRVDAPYLRFTQGFSLGESGLKHYQWSLIDLQLPSIEGILGIDFFAKKNWVIDLKQQKIVISKRVETTKTKFPLIAEYDGSYRALEFRCPDGKVARIDTGSEVDADLSPKLAIEMTKNKWSCGDLKQLSKFEVGKSDSTLFTRDVQVNYGWPWLKNYSRIIVSFEQGWISFEE